MSDSIKDLLAALETGNLEVDTIQITLSRKGTGSTHNINISDTSDNTDGPQTEDDSDADEEAAKKSAAAKKAAETRAKNKAKKEAEEAAAAEAAAAEADDGDGDDDGGETRDPDEIGESDEDVTVDDIKDAARKVVVAKKADVLKKLTEKYKVKKISEADPEHFPAILKALTAALD